MQPPHPSLSARNWFRARLNDDGSTTLHAYKGSTFRYELTATRREMNSLGPVLSRSVGPIIYETTVGLEQPGYKLLAT